MSSIVRIPISNVFMDGDYTGRVLVGPHQRPMNVILDTGSSAFAIDGHKYAPDLAGGDKSTDLAQSDSYGDGSTWTGAVIQTTVTLGDGASSVKLRDANISVAYTRSANMFRQADGILGLAYAPLDDAFKMPQDTWKHRYSSTQVRAGQHTQIVPFPTQLQQEGITSDKIAFLVRRSFVHVGGGNAADPLNQGLMIMGGGDESTDLYTPPFQTVKMVSDDWYSTVLKAVIVGNSPPIAAGLQGPQGMPSNSIVDSGTNSLNLGPQMLQAIVSKFSGSQQELLKQSMQGHGNLVSVNDLGDLSTWPTLTFVLQGDAGDVSLDVPPSNYWQVNTDEVGKAKAAIEEGDPGLTVLGLPLMNGYFTIFDGEADNGRGVVKFAKLKS